MSSSSDPNALPAHALSTRVLPGADADAVAEAAAVLRAGGLVALPTETVYGLGANALDADAVARIFAAKERPFFDPLIVHLADPADLALYVDPADAADPRVARLAARFWPGPLTIVLRRLPLIPGIVTAGLDTVAVRVPDHPVARTLIAAAGVPVAAPSANRFGRISPTRAEHVVAQLEGRVGIVLDGGPCRVGVESTVILLAGGRAVLLRPGGLPIEPIEAEIGPLDPPSTPTESAVEPSPIAPGQLASHYAPHAPVVLVDASEPIEIAPGEHVGLLAASDAGRADAEVALRGGAFDAVEVLAPDGDPVASAARLFECLHRLDAVRVEGRPLDRIVAQPVASVGLGRAILDRLTRAAAIR